MGYMEKWTRHRGAGTDEWATVPLWPGEIGFETTWAEDDGGGRRRLC